MKDFDIYEVWLIDTFIYSMLFTIGVKTIYKTGLILLIIRIEQDLQGHNFIKKLYCIHIFCILAIGTERSE